MMDKKSGFLQKKYLNKPAFQPNVKKALMRYPVIGAVINKNT